MSKWVELKFKDVPVGSDFGLKDYFMYKYKEGWCSYSGDTYEVEPDIMVVMEVGEDE